MTALRPVRWFREFGRPPRILGLDVARGLAILGMAGAHVGMTDAFDWGDPTTWTDLVHGRSSILFALLAGVSIALMTGRDVLPERERLPGIRLNLVGRGAVIFVIGLALELLNTPIAVILTLYGLLYVAVIPVLRWRPRQLLLGAAVLALAGPALLALISAVALQPFGAGIGFVLYGTYPITVWLALVLGGMALGRLRVQEVRTAVVALVVGVVLAAIGYGLGALGAGAGLGGTESIVSSTSEDSGSESLDSLPAESLSSFIPDDVMPPSGWESYPEALAVSDPLGSVVRAVFAVDPHSGGTAEILGSGGFALAVIALCLLLSRPLRWLLLPLGALGSMPLTAYSLHVVSVVLVAGPGGFIADNSFWGLTAVVLLVVTTLWSMFVGRGPLERLVGKGAAAMAAVPRR
ncbi:MULTISPECIES: heparan-alpha-glucosaminide N-acetyltransferase domain-containing protein [unclassified Microbacterium]|uniref:heparan-alpha-glucosaminide N-acetyltransferase domain-containing protein n=1 Tax=unclassified Microbacterium TaxID=2609290 RepID=UPI00246925B5|nr:MULTISPECIES: heparan-alpha-glucosaminide N-acetyltransferase domain-containing protein [unclassified Microbacterium]MDH5134816.1 heparan-alpha-glucosaminide N-acetyltransferase domain-containing protein [Microbacterium sp. RD10]MDH5138396.1 heparan-alpha-glucosaminide N-acetyltransferase domain-containing protein [Microbacterium sp. RD11]MDH5144655.1 heparan-alpha-glucosaminide N-acetyltransferase domain-containing protein [Microbacterium sp. RD12]MDH5154670.1 heparan-alpha-glucosaminide N-